MDDMRNRLFGSGPRPGGGLPSNPGQQRAGGGAGPSPRYPSNPPPQQQPYDPPRQSYNPPPQQPYGRAPSGYGNAPPPSDPYARSAAPTSRKMPLRLAKVENKTLQEQYIFNNICAVSPEDFPPRPDGDDYYLLLSGPQMQGDHVVMARPTQGFPRGAVSLSEPLRRWLLVGLNDQIYGEAYNPTTYLGAMDLQVGFASLNKTTQDRYDQDELQKIVISTFNKHMFAPGQRLLLDVRGIVLAVLVKTVTLVDLNLDAKVDSQTSSDPAVRGVLTNRTDITFFKDPSTPLNLKASSRKAAANSIVSPDFKFEDMGIGGLDKEFGIVFRRAFASRIFPPALIEKLGIQHVKGILLYGPPGTGKTLIARQIGKMLNAHEPKIINGPEVLNKYVGQSEENIRKLFADAEREYKERGDESELHIIIFDELDAVCKQRGSGAGGGTGVGDSVVNQLLSKLDGVDQLNNILLIGMTNRKDMIDDALLRPGRLEVQVEITLPDQAGREQILRIHLANMIKNKVIADDVNPAELAAMSKNFSGAELSGLVRSATSFAFSRHTKVGTMAGVDDSVADMKVAHADFLNALAEMKIAFGADEELLQENVPFGIVKFSSHIQTILDDGLAWADALRSNPNISKISVLMHGPKGSGKTALAAHLAIRSGFPFIKLVSAASLLEQRDELARKDQLLKTMKDAYKSPLSLVIFDGIEHMIEWNPIGPRLSNVMVQALQILIHATPPKGHQLLILATTSRRNVLQQLEFTETFDREVAVPAVRNTQELHTVLTGSGAFVGWPGGTLDEVIDRVRDISGSDEVGVGVRTVLSLAAESTSRPDPVAWLADELSQAIATARYAV